MDQDSGRDMYEQLWTDTWGDMQRYGPVHRHHRVLYRRMLSSLRGIETVLDVGCGEGSNIRFIQSVLPEARISGLDISETSLERVRTFLPRERTHRLDIQMESPSAVYDLTFSSDVVEHLPDDEAALENIYRATAKYFLVGTVQGRMRNFEHRVGHVRNYAPGELQAKCERAGFKVLRCLEWGWPLFSPLYRDLLDLTFAESATHGQYGFAKRMLCHALYGLFFLNSSHKGDVIIMLCGK